MRNRFGLFVSPSCVREKRGDVIVSKKLAFGVKVRFNSLAGKQLEGKRGAIIKSSGKKWVVREDSDGKEGIYSVESFEIIE